MGKRKRQDSQISGRQDGVSGTLRGPQPDESLPEYPKAPKTLPKLHIDPAVRTTIQIVVGTYEKVLHGVTAAIDEQSLDSTKDHSSIDFADTFLFAAHDSAIRCIALAPRSSTNRPDKIVLASGGSDQSVNLYQLSTLAPLKSTALSVPSLGSTQILQNPANKELGSLQYHGGAINALQFSTRSKLLSAAEDSTIAITRTRDWTVLSAIKAPIPKAHGRPSGDTAPFGGTPAGINHFAIHPSMKLMVSVGKGEKCMRLWNLITGKKAGVLNFEKMTLHGIGEGRWASGEGRRVEWNIVGEEFVVAFERGCLVYGIDSKPKCRLLPMPSTKIHQIRYLASPVGCNTTGELIAVSTEDGRILFYATAEYTKGATDVLEPSAPLCPPRCQLGGLSEGMTERIKDFEILFLPESTRILIVTGGSDGAIRVWELQAADIFVRDMTDDSDLHLQDKKAPRNVGRLLGTYEAGNRITCLTAFIMTQPANAELNHNTP